MTTTETRTYTVVLMLAYRGATYATQDDATRVLEAFGDHALSTERTTSVDGTSEVRVAVADQRGERGAHRLHALASAAGVPVHIDY